MSDSSAAPGARTGAAVRLDGRSLTPAEVVAVARHDHTVELAPVAHERNDQARRLAGELVAGGATIYGRTTGVGALLDRHVGGSTGAIHDLGVLRSHAAGAGAIVDRELARALLAVRVNQLGAGGAGVDPSLLEAPIAALNAGLAPAVHELGSVGTGDLTTLAEAGLALLGEGAWLDGATSPLPGLLAAGDALPWLSSDAPALGEAALGSHDAAAHVRSTEAVAALSFTAVCGNVACLDERVSAVRAHPGQIAAAAHLRELIGAIEPARLQDPLCYRCLPQVQGTVRDVLGDLQGVLAIELNTAGETPLLDTATGRALPTGNFHVGRLAISLDTLRTALVQSASLSAQRLSTLLAPRFTDQAPFLAASAGTSSGVLALEYPAYAALEQLRALAHPVAAGTAVLSHGLENHASFAALGARQPTRALETHRTVLAAELVAAIRALRLSGRRPDAPAGRDVLDRVAEVLPADLADRELAFDLAAANDLLCTHPLA